MRCIAKFSYRIEGSCEFGVRLLVLIVSALVGLRAIPTSDLRALDGQDGVGPMTCPHLLVR